MQLFGLVAISQFRHGHQSFSHFEHERFKIMPADPQIIITSCHHGYEHHTCISSPKRISVQPPLLMLSMLVSATTDYQVKRPVYAAVNSTMQEYQHYLPETVLLTMLCIITIILVEVFLDACSCDTV